MRREDVERLRTILAGRAPAHIEDEGAKQAAVAVILRLVAGDEVELLLIRRAERPGDHWSGHMAFPGGRAEPEDADLRATAARETREEVGLDLDLHGELLGPLDQQWPRTGRGLVVSPWVWLLKAPDVALTPNAEVAQAIWTPLGPMLRGETRTEYPFRWNGMDVRLPGYKVEEHTVWGMTHRMLDSLFELLAAVDASAAPRADQSSG